MCLRHSGFLFSEHSSKQACVRSENKKAIAVAMAFLVVVGVAGFEPATPCSQSRCANRTALYPEVGVSVGVLFCGCKYRKLSLTPIHAEKHFRNFFITGIKHII